MKSFFSRVLFATYLPRRLCILIYLLFCTIFCTPFCLNATENINPSEAKPKAAEEKITPESFEFKVEYIENDKENEAPPPDTRTAFIYQDQLYGLANNETKYINFRRKSNLRSVMITLEDTAQVADISRSKYIIKRLNKKLPPKVLKGFYRSPIFNETLFANKYLIVNYPTLRRIKIKSTTIAKPSYNRYLQKKIALNFANSQNSEANYLHTQYCSANTIVVNSEIKTQNFQISAYCFAGEGKVK